MNEGEDVCGETFDHKTELVDSRDGVRVYHCRTCGAEIIEEDEKDDAQ